MRRFVKVVKHYMERGSSSQLNKSNLIMSPKTCSVSSKVALGKNRCENVSSSPVPHGQKE